jgi:L-fuconolactonase
LSDVELMHPIPIVDSHIHFWDPGRLNYPWLQDLPTLNHAFLPAHLAQAATAVNLQKIVFVQADCVPEDGLAEVAWVSQLAQTEPRIQGIVAFAPLENRAASASYLEKLKAFPLVKGVRRLIQSEAPGFASQPEFIHNVQQLAQFGFSFDICIIHPQMSDTIELVSKCPEVAFVLDHFGKPAIAEKQLEPWAKQIRTLAQFPYVSCKLSGLVTEADHQNWTVEDLRPYLEIALDAFGPQRLMFGGDWPVSELAASYQQWVETAYTLLSTLSEADRQRIFFDNAQAFYWLDE